MCVCVFGRKYVCIFMSSIVVLQSITIGQHGGPFFFLVYVAHTHTCTDIIVNHRSTKLYIYTIIVHSKYLLMILHAMRYIKL